MDKDINLDYPWCIGEEKYSSIVSHLRTKSIKRILECGSGRSTIRFAMDFPDADIYSLENSRPYLEETDRLRKKHKLKNIRLIHCPLRFYHWNSYMYYSYDTREISRQTGFDFLLVDGPPERLTVRGREGALNTLLPLCNKDALVGLDDYHRKVSKDIANIFLDTWRGSVKLDFELDDFVFFRKIDCDKTPKRRFPHIFRTHSDACVALLRAAKGGVLFSK